MNFLATTGGLRWLLVPLLLALLYHILPAWPIINEIILGDSPISVEIKILDTDYKVKNNLVQTTKDDENSTVINIEISGIPNHDNLIAKLNKQKHEFVYTVDQNGNKHLFSESGRWQDGPEYPISHYFTAVGTVLHSKVDSQLFVTGYDNKNGSPILTHLLINIGKVTFYLKPFHSLNYIDPNRQKFHLVKIHNQLEEYFISEAKQILRLRRSTNGMTDSYSQNQKENGKKSCGIKLVFDYSFYLKMDQDIGKVNLFANYVIFIVNLVFRNTVFTESGYANDTSNKEIFTDYGLILCEVVIHQHDNDQIPYNRLGTWNQSQLMELLSQSLGDEDFCLEHLFTNNRFEGSYGKQFNGFASIRKIFTDHNVGATSFAAYQSYQLSGILNFVHEIGHNFGATHDSKNHSINDMNCLPETGGSFIMYKYPLITYGPNNFLFSTCSIQSIWKTIKDNRDHFIEIDGCKSCENNILEEDEECDDSGPCCDQKTCRLKLGASCSPVHSGCCDSNCQFKPNKTICAPKDLESCLEEVLCDGVNAQCPNDRIPLPNGTRCNNKEKTNGTCLNGFCRFTCSDIEYFQCQCDSQYPCIMCCSPVGTFNHCLPMLKLTDNQDFSNGTHHGKCFDGEFVNHDESTFIPHYNMDTYLKCLCVSIAIIIAIVVPYKLYYKCNKTGNYKPNNSKENPDDNFDGLMISLIEGNDPPVTPSSNANV